MWFLLPSFSLSLLPFIASSLISFSALGGQKHTQWEVCYSQCWQWEQAHAHMDLHTKITVSLSRNISECVLAQPFLICFFFSQMFFEDFDDASYKFRMALSAR